MPSSSRDIKRRIRAIGNTRKITKAMEMVAASKMRRAVQAVLATRAYSSAGWRVMQELAANTDPEKHPLLQKRDGIKKVGLVLIASNRGLCGGFNRVIIDRVAEYIRAHKNEQVDVEAEIFLIGKRGRDIMFRHGKKIVAEFAKLDVATRIHEVTPMAKLIIHEYLAGTYDKIVVAYTDYISTMKHEPAIKVLLPIGSRDPKLEEFEKFEQPTSAKIEMDFLFEPSVDEVLDAMLYRLVELQLFQALLESNASEHAARMMSMQQASDAASDMIDELTLIFNQTRQASITAELADISGGRAALE